MQPDPYTPPRAELKDHAASDDVVAVREAHVRHEVLLKSVGLVYGLFGFILLSMGLSSLGFLRSVAGAGFVGMTLPVGILAVSVGVFVLAFGFRTLRPWVTTPSTILSALFLLMFPVGTLINGYILYLIWCARGRCVLSPDYRDIIARAPTVRYRRSVGDWVATGILGAMALGVVGMLAIRATMGPG